MKAVEHASIEDQAAAWLVRLDSRQATAAERAQFETWLRAHPRHRVAFLRLQVAWRRVDKLAALGAFEKQTNGSRAPVFAVAATMLVGVGLAALFAFNGFGARVYATEVGNSGRFVLEDGSTMVLNTDTRVRISMTQRQRRITLSRGEAYFQVAPDMQRPFEVRAGTTNVRALGTAFSVRLREREEVEVLVSQGKVAVEPDRPQSKADTALGAGDSVIVTSAGIRHTQLRSADIPRRLAWQDGLLRFNGETLAQAVAEFNRYNRRRLVIADPSIADIHIGGGFQTTDLESFVKALQDSFQVQAQIRDADGIIDLRPASN